VGLVQIPGYARLSSKYRENWAGSCESFTSENPCLTAKELFQDVDDQERLGGLAHE
jgi:hypothetical protein